MAQAPSKPKWFKIRPPSGQHYAHIKHTLRAHSLHTVCEEAHCPNLSECWGGGTATFMILGDTCTRGCRFCAVKTGNPKQQLDPLEPFKVARSLMEWGLKYAVITSVDRDDLPDGGAGHFAKTIRAIKAKTAIRVEVLIPDFQGDPNALRQIVDAQPDVIAHNIETVERLTPSVRDRRARYDQSLRVLENAKAFGPSCYTKSSIMVGLGETHAEVEQTMKDLRSVGVDVLTVGQYLRPTRSRQHLAVVEYLPLEAFERYKLMGEALGFLYVASGPMVRSSYRAGELFMKALLERGGPSDNEKQSQQAHNR